MTPSEKTLERKKQKVPVSRLHLCVCVCVCVCVCACVLASVCASRGHFPEQRLKWTHQGVPEEFIFGIVLPEEEFTLTTHRGLDLNNQLMVLQTSLYKEREREDEKGGRWQDRQH